MALNKISQVLKRIGVVLPLVGLMSMQAGAQQASEPLRLYLDADRTNATMSGDSIEAGMRAAVKMHGGKIHGRAIEFVMLDHRGNTRRSKRSLEKFAADPQALAVFTGLHSPPVLSLREMINSQQLLMMDPWAAAGPITRPETTDNWIFRLSVDDANAGQFIADTAINEGIQKPGLLLEETGWGKANDRVMSRTVSDRLGKEPSKRWFNWGMSQQAMRLTVSELVGEGVDAIFFVGNTPEGVKLIKALVAIDEDVRPRLYSHWGILGGDLLDQVSEQELEAVDLKFIQTRFDLEVEDSDALVMRAFHAAQEEGFYKDCQSPCEISAPTGFVHGFDLTRVLLQAIDQAGLTGDIATDRQRVRKALEGLEKPVTGIVKTYSAPFRPYEDIGSDAHEALGPEDYTLARFDAMGHIEQIKTDAVGQSAVAPTETE